MKRGRRTNALVTIRNWMEDARKEIRCASRPSIPARSDTKFHNIVADAARLGCSRIHLYLVLNGNRTSHSLLRRYNSLKLQTPNTKHQHEH